MKKIFFLLLFSFTQVLGFAQLISFDWASIDTLDVGGISPVYKQPHIIVDSVGDIAVLGSADFGGLVAFNTSKISKEGEFLWQKFHDTYGLDIITTGVIDNAGSIYVAGNSFNPALGTGSQSIVIKYSKDGEMLWQYYYAEQVPGTTSSARKLLLTPEGNILFLGNNTKIATNTSGMIFACLNPQGEVIWEETNAIGGLDVVRGDDRYYVWGNKGLANNQRAFACWQIGLEGGILDYNYTEVYTDDFNWDNYLIDRSGNLLIGDNDGSYKVTSYSPSGAKNFFYTLPDPPVMPSVRRPAMFTITQDKAGDYYCGGLYILSDTVTPANRLTKLSPDGNLIWEKVHYFSNNVSENASVHVNSRWLNDSILAVVGIHAVEIMGVRKFPYYLMLYNSDGLMSVYQHLVSDTSYSLRSIECRDSTIFLSGQFSAAGWNIGRYLHKHTVHLSQLSNLSAPDRATSLPLSIIPNPGSISAAVLLPWEGSAATGTLSIYTLEGRCVSTEVRAIQSGDNVLSLHTAALLPSGQYLVTVQVADRYYTGQWVKM